MVKKDQIGTVHYSKVLDRNVTIEEHPSDEFYKLIGLDSVLESEVKDKKKKDDSDK